MTGLLRSFFIPLCTHDFELRFPLSHEAPAILDLYQDPDLAKEMPFPYDIHDAQKLVDTSTTSKLLFLMDRKVTPSKIVGMIHWKDMPEGPSLSCKLNMVGKQNFLEAMDILLHMFFMLGGYRNVIVYLSAQAFLERRLLYYRGFRPQSFQNSPPSIPYEISRKAYYTSTLLPSQEDACFEALYVFLKKRQLLLNAPHIDNPRDPWCLPTLILEDKPFELTLVADIQKKIGFSVHPLDLDEQIFVATPHGFQLIYTCDQWEALENPQPEGLYWVDIEECPHRPISIHQSLPFYRLLHLIHKN